MRILGFVLLATIVVLSGVIAILVVSPQKAAVAISNLANPRHTNANSDDAAVHTLIQRFDTFCLRAYPDEISLRRQADVLGLMPEEMAKIRSLAHGAAREGWYGDLGGPGPDPQRDLAVVIGSSSRPGCLVGAKVTGTQTDAAEFGTQLNALAARRPGTKLLHLNAGRPDLEPGEVLLQHYYLVSGHNKVLDEFLAVKRQQSDGSDFMLLMRNSNSAVETRQ